jgi:hypothetical protein
MRIMLLVSVFAFACSGGSTASAPAHPTTEGSAVGSASPPSSEYAPCAGKKCGDSCSICPPDAKDCFETAEVKVCGADGKCSGSAPMCP